MVSQEELGSLLFYSMRYTYGRMTYAVDEVVTLVKRHYHQCSKRDRDSMFDDLGREIQRNNEACRLMGVEYTHDMWLGLLEFMRNARETIDEAVQ